MSKIVYFIASHTNPEQVIRLVNRLTGSINSEIVIHHDYSSSYLDSEAFISMKNVHLMDKQIPVYWGDFSLVTLTLHAIEWISTHLEFDWLVFISGQDYPIQPLNRVEEFLQDTPYDGFISGVPLEESIPCGSTECPIMDNAEVRMQCPDCSKRYYYQYYKMPLLIAKLLKRFTQLFRKTQAVVCVRGVPSPAGFRKGIGIRALWGPLRSKKCYKGSQWFTINRKCVDYINQFVNKNPLFLKYYQRTIIPDESFFHTILFNNPSLKLANDNKRFISWSDPKSRSPNIFKIQDLDDIVSCNQHFARKFDINIDNEVLNRIDRYILSKQK